MKTFDYREHTLKYEVYGNPKHTPVMLLHGYLESHKIWEDFIPLFEESYYLIVPDIPGHGESGVFSTTHTMEELAEIMRDLILSLGIQKVNLVGHSMGGYVSLAFADQHSEYLHSCVLFHSACLPDTEEKRANRNREIDLIRDGKKNVLVNTHISMAFADDNLEEFSEEIEKSKRIAATSEDEGIIALLEGMKLRPERCHLLSRKDLPFLLIAGNKDNYIAFEKAKEMADSGSNTELAVLENSGHMGFVEEKDKSAEILKTFFSKHS
jgi:pimeloyl-ACP methyl ester carboxylesterase